MQAICFITLSVSFFWLFSIQWCPFRVGIRAKRSGSFLKQFETKQSGAAVSFRLDLYSQRSTQPLIGPFVKRHSLFSLHSNHKIATSSFFYWLSVSVTFQYSIFKSCYYTINSLFWLSSIKWCPFQGPHQPHIDCKTIIFFLLHWLSRTQ